MITIVTLLVQGAIKMLPNKYLSKRRRQEKVNIAVQGYKRKELNRKKDNNTTKEFLDESDAFLNAYVNNINYLE